MPSPQIDGHRAEQLRIAGRILIWLVAGIFVYKVGRAAWLNAEGFRLIDFYNFWDAAVHVVQGNAPAAYATRDSPAGVLPPFAYPPAFLLLLAPFGLTDFGPALFLWLGITGLIYVLTARQPARLVLVNPPAAYNGLFGQNGFLTCSIMLAAAHLVRSRPLLGGALFGGMVIKPHLAILVPLALAAGRHWSCLLAATVSGAILLGLPALTFGDGVYRGFIDAIPQYAARLVEGSWPWNLLASPYAFLRWFAVGDAVAFGLHGAIALGAAALVWTAWRQAWESRIAVLAAASVLVPPYLFTYDSVVLIAPLGLLAVRKPAWALVMWLLLFVPVLGTTLLRTSVLPLAIPDLPNTTPLGAVLALIAFYLFDRREDRIEPACRS